MLLNLHKRLPIQSLIIADYRPIFTICQNLFALGVEVCFTRIGEDCGGCLTCEELVGVSHRKNYMQPCVTASNKK